MPTTPVVFYFATLGDPVITRSSALSARAPLVGRRVELQAFDDAVMRVADSVPAVIHVTGEIGIGRTRLLQEFAARAQDEGDAVLLTRTGRQDERPLSPLLAGDVTGPLNRFRDALLQPGSDGDHFGHVMAALADTAAATPVWLLIDDLHATDEATQCLVERLLAALHHGSLRSHPVGVVLSMLSGEPTRALRERLELQDRDGAGRHLALRGLSRDEVRTWLISRFATAPDDDLVTLLADASGGNVLLLSELTTYLQRTGLLQEIDGYLTAAVTRPGADLPRDLTSLLARKIDSISSECRRAMTLAACLGDEFQPQMLADLLHQETPTLKQVIDEARRAALVEHRPEGVVGFTHATARDYFYAAPERSQREQNHLSICQQLIGEFGDGADEHCLTITHHLLKAGASADPEAVVHFAPRAADIALRHHSFFLAGRYYEAAARAAAGGLPDSERARLFCLAGEAFQRWSDGGRSTACFEEATRLYEACDDLAGFARSLQGLLRNRISFGEANGSATEIATQLENLIGRLPEEDARLRVQVHDILAGHYHARARYDVAETYAQTAMTIAKGSEDPALRCIPVTSLALAQMEQLRLMDAKTTWLEGLSYDRAAGARRYEGYHLQRLPIPLYCMGEIPEAMRYNQASYQHNQEIGNTGELCLNLTVDVMVANLRGEFETAIRTGREAMDLMATTRYLWSAPSLIGALAYAYTMRERFDDAESVIDHLSTPGLTFEDTAPYHGTAARLMQLLESYRRVGWPGAGPLDDTRRTVRGVRIGSISRLCAEAELALFQRRPERLTGVHDTLEYVHRRGIALAMGWCCSIPRSLAVSTALRGDVRRAAMHFDEARRLAERCLAPLELARVDLYQGMATLADEQADRGPARALLAGAREAFEQLGAPALAEVAARAERTARTDRETH